MKSPIENEKLQKLLDKMLNAPLELIAPSFDTKSDYGYAYPFLDFIADYNDQLALLNWLERQGALKKAGFEPMAQCPHCSSIFLTLCSGCPNCSSNDVQTIELVHHFRCGNVSSITDYMQEHGLTCPKCSNNLRHIGVDYEKPSTAYQCNYCNERFSNLSDQLKCLCCNTYFNKKLARNMKIFKYEPDIAGILALSRGEVRQESKIEPSYPLFAFDAALISALKREIKRAERKNSTVAFIYINIQNYAELASSLESEIFAATMDSFVTIFREALREIDIQCSYGKSSFLAALPDTLPDTGKMVMERLEVSLAEALQDDSYELEIQTSIVSYPDDGHNLKGLLELIGILF